MFGIRTSCWLLALVAASGAQAQVTYFESEPNEIKALASSAMPMAPGDMLTGITTGAVTTSGALNSLDTWLVQTAAAPQDLYRYRLVLTTAGTVGHTGTIRGLNQTAGGIGATDSVAQTSSTATFPPRYVQWYGFGRQEQIYYRVTGTASTTLDYVGTLEREVVTPQVVTDPIVTGPVTISTLGQTTVNTDMWLYDANFNAIPDAGNDDESIAGGGTGATAQSLLTRTLTPGDYYLAITVSNLANNLASPFDDDIRTGIVLDFPDAVSSSSTVTSANLSFVINHLGGSLPVFAQRFEQYEIVWVRFTVVEDTANRPPFGSLRVNPAAGFNDGATTATFTVEVFPGANPPSTGLGVTIDASAIGIAPMAALDNGVPPDAFAGDNIFTAAAVIPASAPAGPSTINFTVSDAEMRSTNSSITYNILPLQDDFGNIFPGISTSRTLDVAATEVKWYRFSLSQDVISGDGTFVDIDTEFSAGCQDTEIGVYRSDGTLVASDDDDGSGGVGVSSLSFGTGTRAASASCGTGGVAYNGRDGSLLAGSYYIAVGRFNVTYGATGFAATSTGPAGAGIQLNIRANVIIGAVTVTPASVLNDGNGAAVVTLTAGPPLTSATIDASAIGGSGMIVALDDGVAPDLAAGDNIFTARVPVADGAPAGAFQLSYTISDGVQTSPGTFNLTVIETVGACCQSAGCSVMPRVSCLAAGGSFVGHAMPCVSSPGYSIAPGGAPFEDISGTGTLISTTGDDTVFSNIPIGFDFAFFGNIYSLCNVSTNGNIQFAPSAATAFLNQPIPTAAVPNNMIAPAWDDFNFNVNTVDDGLYRETRGTPGVDLRFIVQWTNVSQFGVTAPGDRSSFQAVLFEDGHIEFRYREMADLSFDSIAGGPGATVGVENADGSVGTGYDYLLILGGNSSLRVNVDSGTDNCADDCPIDFNGDGVVDPDDLGDFINCYFGVPPCAGADFNNDGAIDPDDLGDFINAYFTLGC